MIDSTLDNTDEGQNRGRGTQVYTYGGGFIHVDT